MFHLPLGDYISVVFVSLKTRFTFRFYLHDAVRLLQVVQKGDKLQEFGIAKYNNCAVVSV